MRSLPIRPAPECAVAPAQGIALPTKRNWPPEGSRSTACRTTSHTFATFCHSSMSIGRGRNRNSSGSASSGTRSAVRSRPTLLASPLSSRRRLADGFGTVKRYYGDVSKQVIEFQINGPTHVNHESIMQIAEFESGKSQKGNRAGSRTRPPSFTGVTTGLASGPLCWLHSSASSIVTVDKKYSEQSKPSTT